MLQSIRPSPILFSDYHKMYTPYSLPTHQYDIYYNNAFALFKIFIMSNFPSISTNFLLHPLRLHRGGTFMLLVNSDAVK
jgi:hypothetical protein